MSPLVQKALEHAVSQIGVRETKRNRGFEVDAYILATGLDPTKGSYPWCCCFVYWSFKRAADELAIPNPMPKVAGVMKLWQSVQPFRKATKPVDGAIFIIDHGKGQHGHCGLVEATGAGQLHMITIEGNTTDSGAREGDGVYRRTRRADEILGYVDFSLPIPHLVA